MLLMIESGGIASEEESQKYHTAMLKPTTNIWELSSILLRNLNSSHNSSHFILLITFTEVTMIRRAIKFEESAWLEIH